MSNFHFSDFTLSLRPDRKYWTLCYVGKDYTLVLNCQNNAVEHGAYFQVWVDGHSRILITESSFNERVILVAMNEGCSDDEAIIRVKQVAITEAEFSNIAGLGAAGTPSLCRAMLDHWNSIRHFIKLEYTD